MNTQNEPEDLRTMTTAEMFLAMLGIIETIRTLPMSEKQELKAWLIYFDLLALMDEVKQNDHGTAD